MLSTPAKIVNHPLDGASSHVLTSGGKTRFEEKYCKVVAALLPEEKTSKKIRFNFRSYFVSKIMNET